MLKVNIPMSLASAIHQAWINTFLQHLDSQYNPNSVSFEEEFPALDDETMALTLQELSDEEYAKLLYEEEQFNAVRLLFVLLSGKFICMAVAPNNYSTN